MKAGDTCYIGPNESREIVNRSNDVCTIAGRRRAGEVTLHRPVRSGLEVGRGVDRRPRLAS